MNHEGAVGVEDEHYFLNMWDSQMQDAGEDTMTETLMQWFSTIDILKHVGANDICGMFSDGVLFVLLLRELSIPEVRHVGDNYLAPVNTFKGKLHNWKILNVEVLQKLNLGVTEWYLEFIAREKKGYAEAVLHSLYQLVQEREKVRPQKRNWKTPSDNSPDARPLDMESVIWGSGTRNRRQRTRNRKAPVVKRYFNSGGRRNRESTGRSVLGEHAVQTYCLLAKKRKQGYPFGIPNLRGRNSYAKRPGYLTYIYKYYVQFPHNCVFCNSIEKCACTDV
ncbi:Sperm flagellar protein 1 [Orchesella cincta]|uniref:Sperm flagellar protein 1 n=1 Tax=Orchesella cincta TaxID=48709 RepID=A0A1D2MNJ5_ORCCI|nr:Sperm flagellar protein 1 [Orchesella cincta]